tara:strand:+ start:2663 stop:3055 length:393 start_codon:yes stop_codon:yes gene_type:complete
MAHGDIVPHRAWETAWVKGSIVCHMQNRAILDAAAGADANAVNVAADGCHGPDGRIIAYFYLTDYNSGLIDKYAVSKLWFVGLEASDAHKASFSAMACDNDMMRSVFLTTQTGVFLDACIECQSESFACF